MAYFLVFQLQAPLSSWGEPAVGEFRGTAEHPGQAALVGLLSAALGLLRTDELAHANLRDGYGYAIGLQSTGELLRDYHTAQVPPRSALKGRPHITRRDEMAVPKRELTTVLSTRDYRQNAASLVAIQPRKEGAPPYALETLAEALNRPRFTLYLGRKACPPAAPLWPQVIDCDSAKVAFVRYGELHDSARRSAATQSGRVALEPLAPVQRIAFDDFIEAGVEPDLTTRRKDRLIRRRSWQFGDRNEHLALIAPKA